MGERTQLVSGAPVPEDQSHTALRANGQQRDYVVLSPEERAKGFVKPVRETYRHIGPPAPEFPLRDLTAEEIATFPQSGYVKFEDYQGTRGSAVGRFWTQAQLDDTTRRCGSTTTMGRSIAETYAREPSFYGGTFCCACGKHLPLTEFEWLDGEPMYVPFQAAWAEKRARKEA